MSTTLSIPEKSSHVLTPRRSGERSSPPYPLSLRERGNAILPSGWRNIGLALGRLWFAAAELEAGDVECRGNRAEPLIHPARGGVDAGSSASVNVPSAPAPLLAGIGMAEGRLARLTLVLWIGTLATVIALLKL